MSRPPLDNTRAVVRALIAERPITTAELVRVTGLQLTQIKGALGQLASMGAIHAVAYEHTGKRGGQRVSIWGLKPGPSMALFEEWKLPIVGPRIEV